MNDFISTNDSNTPAPITYADVTIDTPEYPAVHAAAVAAGVIAADAKPARICLANGRWHVAN
jgi:hypothetical protein